MLDEASSPSKVTDVFWNISKSIPRALRGFQAAILLTIHVVPPFVYLGGQQEGSPPTCDEVSGLSHSYD